jgi:hypothetical protein
MLALACDHCCSITRPSCERLSKFNEHCVQSQFLYYRGANRAWQWGLQNSAQGAQPRMPGIKMKSQLGILLFWRIKIVSYPLMRSFSGILSVLGRIS